VTGGRGAKRPTSTSRSNEGSSIKGESAYLSPSRGRRCSHSWT
jgi:hypothetical protein